MLLELKFVCLCVLLFWVNLSLMFGLLDFIEEKIMDLCLMKMLTST